jgi:hypothetical protein
VDPGAVLAYKSLPEEADAYDIQGEYQSMLQAKREADAAAKRAVDKGATPGPEPDEIELDESDFIEVSTP